MEVKEICKITKERLNKENTGCFEGMEKPLLLISDKYPGIWLEHVYDSVFYAMQDRSKLYLAENTVNLFIDNQSPEGQYPCFVLNKGNANFEGYRCPEGVSYWQIQECVSFARLCWLVYGINKDREFLKKIYASSQKWVGWLRANRMTRGEGLVECFVGYDTGHDNSGRLEGLSCKGNYAVDGVRQNAAVLPENDDVAPVIAVDMNCNFYATLTALSSMAGELGLTDEASEWTRQARTVKEKLFEICFDKEDCFFYDVDKNGVKRKYLSSTVFHLFMEGVLDKNEDAELIAEIYRRHIANPNEFATPYPYPSMAVNDPSRERHYCKNSWGYMSMGLIAIRATLWMEEYGFEREFENLCRKFVEVWTTHFDKIKLGQEYDPVTGVPTQCSEWYSSTMLFYLYAANRYDNNCQPCEKNGILEGKTISFLGDSYFAGNGLDKTLVWPYMLASKYNMNYNNYGVNGSPVSNFAATITPMVDRYTSMADNAPDIVVVEGGRNDFCQRVPLGEDGSTDTKTFKGAMRYLLTKLKVKYPDAVIIGVTIWDYYTEEENRQNYKLGYSWTCSEYGKAFIKVCEDMGIPYIDAMDKTAIGVDVTNAQFRRKYCMAVDDRSHLNAEGMKMVLPVFEKRIAEIYSRTKGTDFK